VVTEGKLEMDMTIINSIPQDLLLYIIKSIAISKAGIIIKDFTTWIREADKLWREHFPEFLEYETQSLVGTRKQRTLPDFTRLAAANVVLPTWKELLRHFVGKSLTENIVTEIETKKASNHIIHGSPVVSDISQLAIFQYEHAVDFGYIESDETVYEVKETDYLDASKIEVSSKEWIIVDKEGKRPLVVPKRNKDGTYGVDGAIILRCQDPYCLEENCKEKHSFFGFLGTHAPGSYASDAVIRVPQHGEITQGLAQGKHIR